MSDGYGSDTLPDKSYKDGEFLRELYVDEKLSTIQIAEKIDCAASTIRKYLKKNGVEIRSQAESMRLRHGYSRYEVPYIIGPFGAEVWKHSHKSEATTVFVHRLVAVAKYGFDAVADNAVHHKNGLRWDNRPENLELMDHGDHTVHHKKKFDPETRRQIADRYANTDDSSYDIADDHDIDPNTVMNIYREHYDDQNGGEKAT